MNRDVTYNIESLALLYLPYFVRPQIMFKPQCMTAAHSVYKDLKVSKAK